MTTTTSAPVVAPATEERPPRQGLARALAVIGLLALTVWWITWTASRSILSESRSASIGRALVHDDAVQAEVASQVREGMYLSGATSLGFTDADIAAAADAVAVDPEVEYLIAERVADAHRAAVRPPDLSTYLTPVDDQPFVESSIRALEAQRDDITIPDLQWLFSTSVDGSFPDLTAAADQTATWRTPALLLAIACFIGSAVAHPDRRPRRWLARWCLAAGLLTLVLPFAMAAAATVLGGDTASVLRAISSSMQGGTPRVGAILLVAIGVLLSLGSRAKARADAAARQAGSAAPVPSSASTPLANPELARTRSGPLRRSTPASPDSRPVWRVSLGSRAETTPPTPSTTPTPAPTATPTPAPAPTPTRTGPVAARNGHATSTSGSSTSGSSTSGSSTSSSSTPSPSSSSQSSSRDPSGTADPAAVNGHGRRMPEPRPTYLHPDALTAPAALRDAAAGAAETGNTTAPHAHTPAVPSSATSTNGAVGTDGTGDAATDDITTGDAAADDVTGRGTAPRSTAARAGR